MAYTEVMMPYRPMVDRAAAFYLFERALGTPLKIRFANQIVPLSDDELQALSDQGIFTIGVGEGRKYTDRGFGSETSAIIHELRSIGVIPDNRPVLDDFARMMDANNDHHSPQGGYLRRQPYAITWIMRQAYRLGNDPSETSFDFTDEEVVRRAACVVSMHIGACLLNHRPALSLRDQALDTAAMQLLPEGKARTHQGPMTVSRYIRDMVACDVDKDTMVARADWFIRVHDRAQARKAAAKKMAASGSFDRFPIHDLDKGGTWVDSDDPYLLEELAASRPLVVMRSSTGNIIIMSKRFDISALADIFTQKEPWRWYYQSQPQVLANGTEGVEMAPSGMPRAEVESEISSLVSC